jgi:PIN domain-containing protein
MSKPQKPQNPEAGSKHVSAEGAPSQGDPSYLNQVFPKSDTVFDRKQESIAEIKQTCLVALDANVLLLPYKMNRVSLHEIGKIYTVLNKEGRLIIPAQAAREFAVHRAAKIAEIVSYLRKEANFLEKPLAAKIGFLENEKAYNDLKEITAKLEKLHKDFRKRAESIVDALSAEIGGDPLSLIYSKLKSSIKELSWDGDERNKFETDLANRSKYKIPPGYADGKKVDGGPGDLLIWKSILFEGKSRNKDCIFVTAEEKPDWWVRNHGTFQPRIELIEEYRNATDGRTIHIVVLSELLALFNVPDETVQTVRRVERANTAIAISGGASGAQAISSHCTFTGTISPKQASELSILRDTSKREVEQIGAEIAVWQAIEPSLITESKIQDLSEERERLRKRIEWIGNQLN